MKQLALGVKRWSQQTAVGSFSYFYPRGKRSRGRLKEKDV